MNNIISAPVVSVIVPVYNTELYLKRCMNSILNQTYKNLEILCVDDGSSDGSGQILDEYAHCDPRVKVFHTENKGVSSARNTALRAAKGEYIGFVDSDDYIDSEYYEKLVNVIKCETVDIVTCGYYIDNGRKISKAENKKQVPTKPVYIKDFFVYMYERDVYKGVGSYLWTRLIKKEIIKNNDGSLKICFKKKYGGIDDIVFIAEASLRSRYIQYIDEPLYYYVQREGSIVHNDYKQLQTLEWVKAYEWMIGRYQKEGIQQSVLDMIRRMYVYRCGKLLETAIEIDDVEKMQILHNKIKSEFIVYVKLNIDNLERIHWMLELLLHQEKYEKK